MRYTSFAGELSKRPLERLKLIVSICRAILHSLGATDSLDTDDAYALAKSFEEHEAIENSMEVLEEEERLRNEAGGKGALFAEESDDEPSDVENKDGDNGSDSSDTCDKTRGAAGTTSQASVNSRSTAQLNTPAATQAKAAVALLNAIQKVGLAYFQFSWCIYSQSLDTCDHGSRNCKSRTTQEVPTNHYHSMSRTSGSD